MLGGTLNVDRLVDYTAAAFTEFTHDLKNCRGFVSSSAPHLPLLVDDVPDADLDRF